MTLQLVEPPEVLEKAYRYESGIFRRVNLIECQVIKHTPGGYWVLRWPYTGDCKHFVLSNARRRYAWPTKEEALTSFIARKRTQIRILKAQMEVATSALNEAETMRVKGEYDD